MRKNTKGQADRIYVLDHEHPNPHRHMCETYDDARTMHEQVPVPPSDSREVLVRHRPHGPRSIVTRLIVAIYGSEGKWVAIDHDYRREYLSAACVVSWQELPAQPVGAP